MYGKNGAFMVPNIVRALDNAEVKISSISVSTPTLDDVFLKHTGRRIRTDGQQEGKESGSTEIRRKRGLGLYFRRRKHEKEAL